jgi:CubicO group peptidase (beta-lactamase class C family)
MVESPTIHGECDSRFTRVRDVFEENFRKDLEIGAAVAVTVDGQSVVDLWAGYADPERTRQWEHDTLVNVYSTTKGMTTICAHRLVDQGLLDLDEKVAHYWPEFAQAGKADIPVSYLLSHRAGLPAVSTRLEIEDLYDWDRVTGLIAAQKPFWEPGSRHGYHSFTFGWLVGEVVRRASGSRSVGTYFRDEIAGPLELDFHIGLADEHHDRVTLITNIPLPPPDYEPNYFEIIEKEPESATAMTITNPAALATPNLANTPEWRRSEIPAGNGHGTARALARVYGALACDGEIDGVQVLSQESIERARTEQCCGRDEVLRIEKSYGLGFMLPVSGVAFGPNDRAFGHFGAGGSLGFADPETHVGFGYVMNLTAAGLYVDERPAALIDALYESL